MKYLRQYIRQVLIEKQTGPTDFLGKVGQFIDTGQWGDEKEHPRKHRHPKLNTIVDAVNDAIGDVEQTDMKSFLWGLNHDFANGIKIESSQVSPPPGAPGSPSAMGQIQDGPESPEDEEALENYELAEKIILAFFQSANQGIELVQYHPDEETASVLGDIFATIRDDVKSFMKVDPTQFKGKMTDQLLYGTKVDNTMEELLGWRIFHMAGWENWMPNPKESAKVMQRFHRDVYQSFRKKWFVNLSDDEKQGWIDWVGGDL